MTTIQNQNYGVEIELTGITRKQAAQVIAEYFNTEVAYLGTYYDTYGARDTKGRTWKAMSDASIDTRKKVNGRIVSASKDYSCEIVTPILQYEDLEDLQQIIRELREAGAMANDSTGIHVHVDGAAHTPESLTRLLNFAVGRQDLFYEALQVSSSRANRWCKKISPKLLSALKHDLSKTNFSTERIWYSNANDGYRGSVDHQHYNETRYHGINLHAFFTKGTVEFRLFNGTTHAGKIKAYIQFCLAMSAWAVNAEDKMYYKGTAGYSKAQKGALMYRVLTKRLGMTGPEFKTARQHLTSAFADEILEEAV